jgi:hypothetical protein
VDGVEHDEGKTDVSKDWTEKHMRFPRLWEREKSLRKKLDSSVTMAGTPQAVILACMDETACQLRFAETFSCYTWYRSSPYARSKYNMRAHALESVSRAELTG